jgi:hypothetical protein
VSFPCGAASLGRVRLEYRTITSHRSPVSTGGANLAFASRTQSHPKRDERRQTRRELIVCDERHHAWCELIIQRTTRGPGALVVARPGPTHGWFYPLFSPPLRRRRRTRREPRWSAHQNVFPLCCARLCHTGDPRKQRRSAHRKVFFRVVLAFAALATLASRGGAPIGTHFFRVALACAALATFATFANWLGAERGRRQARTSNHRPLWDRQQLGLLGSRSIMIAGRNVWFCGLLVKLIDVELHASCNLRWGTPSRPTSTHLGTTQRLRHRRRQPTTRDQPSCRREWEGESTLWLLTEQEPPKNITKAKTKSEKKRRAQRGEKKKKKGNLGFEPRNSSCDRDVFNSSSLSKKVWWSKIREVLRCPSEVSYPCCVCLYFFGGKRGKSTCGEEKVLNFFLLPQGRSTDPWEEA